MEMIITGATVGESLKEILFAEKIKTGGCRLQSIEKMLYLLMGYSIILSLIFTAGFPL